jgi:hypothetical protein
MPTDFAACTTKAGWKQRDWLSAPAPRTALQNLGGDEEEKFDHSSSSLNQVLPFAFQEREDLTRLGPTTQHAPGHHHVVLAVL